MCPKILSFCRRRRRLICFAAEGCHDPYQASQKCSQRQLVPGFEPRMAFGTKVETIKFFCIKNTMPRTLFSTKVETLKFVCIKNRNPRN
jgi:hypothetical protein